MKYVRGQPRLDLKAEHPTCSRVYNVKNTGHCNVIFLNLVDPNDVTILYEYVISWNEPQYERKSKTEHLVTRPHLLVK